MQLKDFDYELPEALIAQAPLAQRTASRLLALTPEGLAHKQFADVVTLLRPGDLLVLNNTKVIKARLYGRKTTGGAAEILVERILAPDLALCQVKVSKALREGVTLQVGDQTLRSRGRQGQFYLLEFPIPVLDLLDAHGHVPLPPYIERADEENDEQRYQTVFSKTPGAVAAPTAGLHFDQALLQSLAEQGVATAEVTLHVGAGTFQPVRGDVEQHVMHSEQYVVPGETAATIKATQEAGGRVIAVGTTVVRTLESAADEQGMVQASSGDTNLFIKPGFEFHVVDALITNFHLPKSTLLMLISAFAGYDKVMEAYRIAVDSEYRFFSYGDAMWLTRSS